MSITSDAGLVQAAMDSLVSTLKTKLEVKADKSYVDLALANQIVAETDPTVPQHVKGISAADLENWNEAHAWGNHAQAGYILDSRTAQTEVTSWNVSSLGIQNAHSVAYGDGKFVAVGYMGGDGCAVSTDGVTWTSSASLPEGMFNVSYGDGKFVAVGYNTVAVSADGISWTAVELPSSASLFSVCYGNGKFVVTDELQNGLYVSVDGVNWSGPIQVPGAAGGWSGVGYGNGKFITVGYHGIAESVDGLTWTKGVSNHSNIGLRAVTYGNGKFVAVNPNGHIHVISSPDDFREVYFSQNGLWNVTYGGGIFMAVSDNMGDIDGFALTSVDGESWQKSAMGGSPGDSIRGVAFGGGKFVVPTLNGTTYVSNALGEIGTIEAIRSDLEKYQKKIAVDPGVILKTDNYGAVVAAVPNTDYVSPGVPGRLEYKTLKHTTLEGQIIEQTAVSSRGGVDIPLDPMLGSIVFTTLTANTIYKMFTPLVGCTFTLVQKQDATGNRTVTWPASIKWPGGVAPTYTKTAGRSDIFKFTAINSTTWLGQVVGLNYAF